MLPFISFINLNVSTYLFSSSTFSIVHGYHFSSILSQSSLTIKYKINTTVIIINAANIVAYVLLGAAPINKLIHVNDNLAPHVIINVNISFPVNVAAINRHILYHINPNGTYTKSSGIGLKAAKNAANHPYL